MVAAISSDDRPTISKGVCASDDDKWMGVWQLIFEFEQGKAIGDTLATTFSFFL